MENNQQDTKKGMNSNIIYLGIIALLAAASIYLFVTKNKTDKENFEFFYNGVVDNE